MNRNFKKFHREQEAHKSAYVSNEHLENRGNLNKSNDNTQENTDISVGAEGREKHLE